MPPVNGEKSNTSHYIVAQNQPYKMQQPPLRFLETATTLLALTGLIAVIAILVVVTLPLEQASSPGATTATAKLSPAYDEQKAIAAGLSPHDEGRQLFSNNCKQCHAVNEVVVGPALGNVTERRSKEWLHAFIKNSSKLIQEGDPEAKALYEQFNRTQMPSFKFSDEEIDAILSHIKFETAAYGR